MLSVCWALAVSALVSLAVLSDAPTAQARPQDGHGPHGAVLEAADGTAELGQFHIGETVVWCIDLNSWGPQQSSGWTHTRTDQIRKQTNFGEDRGGHSDVAGALLSREEIAELAWVLEWAAEHVTDDASAIAVDHFIRLRTVGDAAQQSRMGNRWAAATKEYPEAQRHLDALTEGVGGEAGPYRLELQLSAEDDRGSVQVVGRAGEPIPGRTVTVTTNGIDTELTTGESGSAGFDLPKLETGAVEVSASAVVPGSIPVLHTARHYDDENHDDYRIQRMLSAGEPARITAADSFRVGADTPTVVTVANTPVADVGAELHDVVRVSGAGGYRGRGEATLWGPYDQPPGRNHCRDDAATAGSVTFEVDGDGSYRTPPVTAAAPGFYTWTVELPPEAGSERVVTPCGVEAETTRVHVRPGIETDIRADSQQVGTTVRDLVLIDGLFAESAQVNATLWGPYPQEPTSEDCRLGDPVAGEVSMTVAGDDGHLTPGVRVDEPGHYVWTVELTGEALAESLDTACGDPREMMQISQGGQPPIPESPTPESPSPESPSPVGPTPETPTPRTPSSAPTPDTAIPSRPGGTAPPERSTPPITPTIPASPESPEPSRSAPSPTPSSSIPPRGKPSPLLSPSPKPSSPQPGPATAMPPASTPTPTPRPVAPTSPPAVQSPPPLPEPESPIRVRSGA